MRFIEEIRDGIMLIKCSNCNEEFEVETKQLELFVKNNSKCACGHTFDFADVKEETQFCEKIYNEDVGQRELEDYKKRLKSGFYDKYMKIKDWLERRTNESNGLKENYNYYNTMHCLW